MAFREENGAFTPAAAFEGAQAGAQGVRAVPGLLRVPESKSVLVNTASIPATGGETLLAFADIRSPTRRGESVRASCAREAYGEERPRRNAARRAHPPGYRERAGKARARPPDELPAPVLRTGRAVVKGNKARHGSHRTVRNVIDFGAFVEIGAPGLAGAYLRARPQVRRHPSEVESVGLWSSCGAERGRAKKAIALSMKQAKHKSALNPDRRFCMLFIRQQPKLPRYGIIVPVSARALIWKRYKNLEIISRSQCLSLPASI